MNRKRRTFTKEFKQEAVQHYHQSGLSFDKAARELGVSSTSLTRWVEQAEIDKGHRPVGLTTTERKEIRDLRRENRRLKMEAEILKKAAAFFARDQF